MKLTFLESRVQTINHSFHMSIIECKAKFQLVKSCHFLLSTFTDLVKAIHSPHKWYLEPRQTDWCAGRLYAKIFRIAQVMPDECQNLLCFCVFLNKGCKESGLCTQVCGQERCCSCECFAMPCASSLEQQLSNLPIIEARKQRAAADVQQVVAAE